MGLTEKSFLERAEYMGLYDPNSRRRIPSNRSCPRCGGELQYFCLTSYLPQYKVQCLYCGYEDGEDIKKPMNNADRLNAMSIEEKAAFLQSLLTALPWCKPDAPIDPETKECLIYDCDKCVIEWLKQEATADAK